MTKAGIKWHPDRTARADHMVKRAADGATVRQIAHEFSVSKSQAGRHVRAARDKADDALRDGYTKEPIHESE